MQVSLYWTSFDQFIFLYKYLFVYRYTAKFELDLLEIRKGRSSHAEAHMLKIIQGTGHNLHNLLLLYKSNKINAGTLND